ncbi:MAG: ABC transporter permease [Firmicutes bacterium]|nr:ABC transporter permease [Bacillota bacterium]
MKKELKGFTKIFAFTFRQQVCRKGYLITTILVALLCLLIPAGVMMGSAWSDRGETEKQPEPENVVQEAEESPDGEENPDGKESTVDLESTEREMTEPGMAEVSSAVKKIFVVNRTGEEKFDAEALGNFDFEGVLEMKLPRIRWIEYGEDFEKARNDSAGTSDTLLLAADRQGDTFVLHLLYPEGSTLTEEDAWVLSDGLATYGDIAAEAINEAAAGRDGEEKSDNMTDGVTAGSSDSVTDGAEREEAEGEEGAPESEDPLDEVRSLLGLVIPYLNIMVLYFFVLLYGQGVAQSVITEKTSKLMEFFLISVRPSAMILGKLTAVCLSGVVQLFSWILALMAGFGLGSLGAQAINPETDMLVLRLLESFGSMTEGMFSAGGVVLALAMLLTGMLLYCSLAGIGGAIAGKPEDLSSTNVMFTLILIGSFFACLLSGGLDGSGNAAGWMDWLPFTAVMVTPARIVLGTISLAKGFGCLLVSLATALLLTILAGRLYKQMVLYKGNIPGPKKLLEMMKA